VPVAALGSFGTIERWPRTGASRAALESALLEKEITMESAVKSFNSLSAFAAYAAASNLSIKVMSVKGSLYRLAAIDAWGNKVAYASGFKVKS